MTWQGNQQWYFLGIIHFVLGLLKCCSAQREASEARYDQLCNEIEQWSRTAGALYNHGRAQEAYTALEKARNSFGAARKVLPSDPQAYVTFATTMLNAQKFDESIYLWRKAKNQVKNGAWGGDKGILAWLNGRIRWSRYGKVSVARDLLYAQGQGNMTSAVDLMNKQLAIYPSSPVLNHDKATAQVMLSELWGSNSTAQAVSSFLTAQKLAVAAWRAGVLERGRGGELCNSSEESNGLVYDWPAWFSRGNLASGALTALDPVLPLGDLGTYGLNDSFRDHGAYVAQFQAVGLSGPDGIIVDEARCQIFIPSSGPGVSLALNLQLLETWGDQPSPQGGPRFAWFDVNRGKLPSHGEVKKPQRFAKAASIVQFADVSHFHALTEVLGRLWLLQHHGVFRDPEVILIARPDRREDEGFLSPVLKMLVPELFKQHRLSWWPQNSETEPDVRIYAERLYYADWRPPAVFGEDGGHCSTPRSVLLQANRMLVQALATPQQPGSTLSGEHDDSVQGTKVAAEMPAAQALIFVLRRKQREHMDMRSRLAREMELRKELKEIAARADPTLSFETFDGSPSAVATSLLFSRARAVVGVHGGALTNILFCQAGAELFEIGFATPFAGHYRHLAAALGIRATLLPLAADYRGIGAVDVRLEDFGAAVTTLRTAIVGSSESQAAAGAVGHGAADEL